MPSSSVTSNVTADGGALSARKREFEQTGEPRGVQPGCLGGVALDHDRDGIGRLHQAFRPAGVVAGSTMTSSTGVALLSHGLGLGWAAFGGHGVVDTWVIHAVKYRNKRPLDDIEITQREWRSSELARFQAILHDALDDPLDGGGAGRIDVDRSMLCCHRH